MHFSIWKLCAVSCLPKGFVDLPGTETELISTKYQYANVRGLGLTGITHDCKKVGRWHTRLDLIFGLIAHSSLIALLCFFFIYHLQHDICIEFHKIVNRQIFYFIFSAGAESAKKLLQEIIILPYLRPEVFYHPHY